MDGVSASRQRSARGCHRVSAHFFDALQPRAVHVSVKKAYLVRLRPVLLRREGLPRTGVFLVEHTVPPC